MEFGTLKSLHSKLDTLSVNDLEALGIKMSKMNRKATDPKQIESIRVATLVVKRLFSLKKYNQIYKISKSLCNMTMGPLKSKLAYFISREFVKYGQLGFVKNIAINLSRLSGNYKMKTLVDICNILIKNRDFKYVNVILEHLKKNKSKSSQDVYKKIQKKIKKTKLLYASGSLSFSEKFNNLIMPKKTGLPSKKNIKDQKKSRVSSIFSVSVNDLNRLLNPIKKEYKTTSICLRNINQMGEKLRDDDTVEPFILFVSQERIHLLLIDSYQSCIYHLNSNIFTNRDNKPILNKQIKLKFLEIFKYSLSQLRSKKCCLTIQED